MDLSNLLDIYTLQYLFLPRINAALKQFITMWNNHKLSSENSHTPLQLLHFDSSRTAMVPNEEEQNELSSLRLKIMRPLKKKGLH